MFCLPIQFEHIYLSALLQFDSSNLKSLLQRNLIGFFSVARRVDQLVFIASTTGAFLSASCRTFGVVLE